MHVEYICRLPSGFTYLCEDGETTVGKIHVVIDDNIATIADVVVTQRVVRRFWFLPIFKKKLTCRNQGYGTNLLNAAIEKCREIGVAEIVGNIVGDTERLKSWYLRNGFKIKNCKISMVIDQRT